MDNNSDIISTEKAHSGLIKDNNSPPENAALDCVELGASAAAYDSTEVVTCFEMVVDGIKGLKTLGDPISDVFSCLTGTACCIGMFAVEAKENRRQANRGDVLHANQRKKRDEEDLGTAYSMGACIGDTVIDTSVVALGVIPSVIRASVLTFFGNNQRGNKVFGLTRETINDTDLYSSCRPVMDCVTTCVK